ncbi:hypothetical protein [Phytohalomonas tamaricis]|uniref:hypothetical protein n=1 Tax=Phytohalomonas tamaricis TaxID=2081032 RepID=UPI001319D25B|nr:hypothetical protein [Phytohalomonas tamaricis]
MIDRTAWNVILVLAFFIVAYYTIPWSNTWWAYVLIIQWLILAGEALTHAMKALK